MIFRNCVIETNVGQPKNSLDSFHLISIDGGAFGLKKTISIPKPQKVYARVVIQTEDKLSKIKIGIVDNGEWYVEEKQGGGTKKLSVVRTCQATTVDVVITVEFANEAVIKDFVTTAVGDTKIEKKTLDKIKYYENDIVNEWHGEPFKMKSSNGSTIKKQIDCSLKEGKVYFIKVLAKEVTNCGRIWLECGHSQASHCEQLVTAFKYVGKLPTIAIKGNVFDYIVDVQAIVIADSNTIPFEHFFNKEYWR